MESSIPVVDFSQMSLEKGTDHEDYAPESIQQLADEIHRAFSTVAFVYLKNHGIPQQKVREFTEKSFLLPWLYVPDYFIHPILGHDVHHQWVSDKTTRGYHLDFTGCEKSRDHCLFLSPSQGDNIWNSPSPPMDEIFWGAGQRGLGRGDSLSLRGLLELTHGHSLQTHWKPLLKKPYKCSQLFKKDMVNTSLKQTLRFGPCYIKT